MDNYAICHVCKREHTPELNLLYKGKSMFFCGNDCLWQLAYAVNEGNDTWFEGETDDEEDE